MKWIRFRGIRSSYGMDDSVRVSIRTTPKHMKIRRWNGPRCTKQKHGNAPKAISIFLSSLVLLGSTSSMASPLIEGHQLHHSRVDPSSSWSSNSRRFRMSTGQSMSTELLVRLTWRWIWLGWSTNWGSMGRARKMMP